MAAQGLKDYLQRYVDKPPGADGGRAKTKKKNKSKEKSSGGGNAGSGVLIVDDDAVWQRELKDEEEDEPDEEGDGPQVIEDVEVKRMHRMEALKTHRPYLSMANDGSGWITVKDDEAPGVGDNSAPRSPQEGKSPDLSAKRKRRDSPDLSPPRGRRDSLDLPPRRKRIDSPDLSPPRRRRRDSPDVSPPRRNDFPDLSPPRRRGSTDLSAPRRRNGSPNLSPPRRRKDSPDLSPPRRLKISSGDSRLGHRDPARRRNDSRDLSPRRRRDSPDLPSARKLESKDSSPPRRPKTVVASPKQNRSQESSPPRTRGSARMSDGTFAGLKSDKEVVSEAERKRAAEAKMLSELDPSLSGRGAETVFRDKRGRRLEGLEEMLRQQRGEAKPAEQPLEWGKGLAQKKVAEENFAELQAEKSRPFARYRDDAELDNSLKERLRWGDPMAHLVKQKNPESALEDLGAREEMKSSGFIVPQDIPKHSWLKRGIPPPPNRYDIRPGRHWDGVDRSTGYEQGLFKSKNEKKARELEAYLWSVSDM